MTIGERIKQRREELGLSVDEVAKKLGKHRATIYRYESNEIEKFPTAILEPIAAVLQTTPAYLMGWEDSLPANVISVPRSRKIPLLGTIPCGSPMLADECFDGEVDLPEHVHADFALKCKGDSMINARIFDGDIVYIRRQQTIENGRIAAVRIGDEATLKRVFYFPKESRLVLRPCNPLYSDMVYTGSELEDIEIIGEAVAFTSLVRHE